MALMRPMADTTLHGTVYSIKAGHNKALGTRRWDLNLGNSSGHTLWLYIDPNDKEDSAIYDVFRQVVTLPLDEMAKDECKDLLPRLKVTYKRGMNKVTGQEVRRVTKLEPLPPTQAMLESANRTPMITEMKAYAESLGLLETKGAEVNEIITRCIVKPNEPSPATAKLEIAKLIKLVGKPLTEEEQARVASASAHITEQIAALTEPEEAKVTDNIDIVDGVMHREEEEQFAGAEMHEPVKPADALPADTEKAYRKDVAATIAVMPKHIKKVLGEEPGIHIRKIYGMSIDMWLSKHNNDLAKAWAMADEYTEGILSLRLAVASVENAPEGQPTEGEATTPPETPTAAQSVPQSAPAAPEPETAVKPSPVTIRTLTGYNVLSIPAELNKHLPPQAYGAIKFGQMSGKTDVDGDYVRDRFDKIFGPMGIGWCISPQESAGRVEYRSEVRTSNNGKEQTWHIVTLIAHTFQYSVIMPDGSFAWVNASTTSDQHDNLDEQYAYRGALTSLMKQFYRLMGGMNHVIRDEYNHNHAARDLARKSA